MREIRTSGSMRGERAAPFVSPAALLYRETFQRLSPFGPGHLHERAQKVPDQSQPRSPAALSIFSLLATVFIPFVA
jgi:hypothetical protein